MSLLNGGLAKAKGLSGIALDWSFIDGISLVERYVASARFGAQDRIGLISAIARMRTEPKWPLPEDHPLNPASRYAS